MVSRPSPTEVQFPSFLTQLKAIATSSSFETTPMASDAPHWSSPTSITTNPTDATSTTSHSLPSFSLDTSQSSNFFLQQFPPRSQVVNTPMGYYSSSLVPPRHTTSTASSSSSSSTSWTAATYSNDEFLHPPPPAPPSTIIPPHPLVLQHSDPLPRPNDEELVMDAQMLHEVLQGMPTSGQTPRNHQHLVHHRGQQIPGLQVLFASPLHATELTPPSSHYYSNAPLPLNPPSADMLLSMNQPSSGPIFPSADRTSSLLTPLPTYETLVPDTTHGPIVPPPLLPRKKRTTATRICKVEGCTKGIRSRGLCKAHGGGRRCTTPGCTTSDQGGGHCVLHGGGRRCRIEGCKKSAQWRGVCKMHGGARRCRYGQCTKNGQVKQGYCRMHHNLLTAQRQQQAQGQAVPPVKLAPSDM